MLLYIRTSLSEHINQIMAVCIVSFQGKLICRYINETYLSIFPLHIFYTWFQNVHCK